MGEGWRIFSAQFDIYPTLPFTYVEAHAYGTCWFDKLVLKISFLVKK